MQAGLRLEEACYLVPEDTWASTSRNWWFQGLLKNVLSVYPGFEQLEYLQRHISAVAPQRAGELARLIRNLLKTISANPEPFTRLDYAEADPVLVRQQVGEARVLRSLDDDCRFAHGNFFSFLLSQAAALQEAEQAGRALLYLQPQPDLSPERLIWPA
ncbi:MAG: hypothetical protein U0931_10265 [Vulcanimicrobiota bacterium]